MEQKYGVIHEEKPEFPVRELLVVPHKQGNLTAGYPAFGPKAYNENLKELGKIYSNPRIQTYREMSFREPNTHESISVAQYGFGEGGEVDAKRDLLSLKGLALGSIVKTSKGIFTNVIAMDESELMNLLAGARGSNGIYLLARIAFAPYESFKTGDISCEEFVKGGLARALEYTPEQIAGRFNDIAKFYDSVRVFGFEPVETPVQCVASLTGGWGDDPPNQMGVHGNSSMDEEFGFVFGVKRLV